MQQQNSENKAQKIRTHFGLQLAPKGLFDCCKLTDHHSDDIINTLKTVSFSTLIGTSFYKSSHPL
jgi:hypothetical protein